MRLYSLQLIGPDGRQMYLKSITLRAGTIYVTNITFTDDKRYAATFDLMDVFQDAADAVDLLLSRQCSACIPAHRNSQGVLHTKFH